MLAGLRKPSDGTDAALALEQAKTLARRVAKSEGDALTQLLGRDTERINLHYEMVPSPGRAAQAPAAGLTIADPETGLPDIAAYYRSTRPARLVITGAPGSGKTVLTLQLLLALIANRDTADPVPVRVPLAQWDTDVPLREVLVQRLVDTFNLSRAVAGNLVVHELVLPVLDGLDEMDPPLPNGDPDPAAPRARAALDQLSAYQDAGVAAPLVLACRTAHYDALTTADHLLDAARIAIAPVDGSPAAAYLTARARDLPRWQPLLDHLTAHPGSVHAVLLSTPWRLCLTATIYHRTGDPAELLTHTHPDVLDDHLLARYVTAATLAASDANPHGYTPQQIHHWLHQLAAHLTSARTDITLGSLWPMAGQARVRTVDALLTTLILLIPLPFIWRSTPPHASFAVSYGLSVLLLGSTRSLAKEGSTGGRLHFHQLVTPVGRRGLKIGLGLGLLGGLAFGLLIGLVGGLGLGLLVGLGFALVVGLGLGLLFGVAADQSSSAKPGTIIAENAQFWLVSGLELGLFFGFAEGLTSGPAAGLAIGLGVGLVVGLGTNVASGRYVAFLLCARGRVPFRLARFLDWGCGAGLMRYSGPAYQFRHRELQLWLAAHPTPAI